MLQLAIRRPQTRSALARRNTTQTNRKLGKRAPDRFPHVLRVAGCPWERAWQDICNRKRSTKRHETATYDSLDAPYAVLTGDNGWRASTREHERRPLPR